MMAPSGKVLRVVINGVGLDLMGAFSKATTGDWAALIGATGRNPFTVAQGMKRAALMGGAAGLDELAGPAGGQLMETIGDLVFLARRMEGERSLAHPDRPITPEESFDTTPFVEALGLAMDVAEQIAGDAERGAEQEPVPDPT